MDASFRLFVASGFSRTFRPTACSFPQRMPVLDRISLGKSGEDLACRELARLGYAILARRYRTRYGEIDIVARDGPTVVFVEVKARTGQRFGEPAEAVTLDKQTRIAAMAQDYLARRRLDHVPCRFDVVAVTFGASGVLKVEVLKSAFDAPAWG